MMRLRQLSGLDSEVLMVALSSWPKAPTLTSPHLALIQGVYMTCDKGCEMMRKGRPLERHFAASEGCQGRCVGHEQPDDPAEMTG